MIPDRNWSPVREDGLVIPTEEPHVPGTDRPVPEPPEPEWVTNRKLSQEWTLDGPEGPVKVRLYTVSALARALGRAPVTIRSWIRLGVIPDARWRRPDTDGGYFTEAGARLWTREQIEALVDIAASEGMLGRHRVESWSQSNFRQRVAARWRSEKW